MVLNSLIVFNLGLLLLLLLVALLSVGVWLDFISPTALSDRGLELLSTTFIFSVLVSLVLYATGCRSTDRSSSLKPHVTGDIIHDWWFGLQLNPKFMGVDLKFFFLKAGVMGWLLINLSVPAKSFQDASVTQSMILYQLFCALDIMYYFFYEECITSAWDIIAERLGFMLVFGDLVWIPFAFSVQGWWLLSSKVELTTAAVVTNCLVFLVGYMIFGGANKQKHDFKKNPKALIWGKPSKVVGGKLLVSGYWGIARHCNYLGDLLLALSFSFPCGLSSPVPYLYPIYLLIFLLWRERRDEARTRIFGQSTAKLFRGGYCHMFISDNYLNQQMQQSLARQSFGSAFGRKLAIHVCTPCIYKDLNQQMQQNRLLIKDYNIIWK